MQVLDALVIIKWYQTEKDTDKALTIRGQYVKGELKIASPSLILLELANAIRFKRKSTPKDIRDVLDNFKKLKIDIIMPTIGLVKEAGTMAYKYNLTIYDGIYLALARNLDYIFVTADEKLYQRTKKLSYVKLLSQL